MRNTLLVDTDLVYTRPRDLEREDSPDLTDIEFEDMEPVAGFDLVGVPPHMAIAILPFVDFDVVGVAPNAAVAVTPTPAALRPQEELEPDAVPTEEFASWDDTIPVEAKL